MACLHNAISESLREMYEDGLRQELARGSALMRHLADRPRLPPQLGPTRHTLERMQAEACLAEIRAVLANHPDARILGDEDGGYSVVVGDYYLPSDC